MSSSKRRIIAIPVSMRQIKGLDEVPRRRGSSGNELSGKADEKNDAAMLPLSQLSGPGVETIRRQSCSYRSPRYSGERSGSGAQIGASIFALVLALAAPAAKAAGNPWGQAMMPTSGSSAAIGAYDLGCLAGGQILSPQADGYLAVRLFRKRNYGHPSLLDFVSSLGRDSKRKHWGTLLVGDLSQARGGPPVSGHRSHQTGLDVDIWFQTLEDYRLAGGSVSDLDRRDPASVVASGTRHVDFRKWTVAHAELLEATASYPSVERVFVNAAIKKHLCQTARGDRRWLAKLRPWWGHDDHFHVRLRCPARDSQCISQPPVPPNDGCDTSLDWWFSHEAHQPKPQAVVVERRLPRECDNVLQQ